jgi:3-dehydroquinate dehydratase-2
VSAKPLLVVLHGANLNLLGERSAAHYGTITLGQLEDAIRTEAAGHGWDCQCYQSNHEGQFIEYLHEFRRADALIVNPGAWTHYSYAIRDALEIVDIPVAEVHLSDIGSREEWRRHSVITEVVTFTIAGKGIQGYLEAVRLLLEMASLQPEGGA